MQITRTEIFTILSLVTPYIFVLFFFRYTDALTFLGLLVVNVLFILGCLTILLLTKETKFKKLYYFIATVFVVSAFIMFRSDLIIASDNIFFSLHKSKMTSTVLEIKKAKEDKREIVVPQLYFASVDTLETGEIIFTLDGMLDNCVGIAYVESNENPGYTNCGRIIEWRKLDDHWYFWYTT